MAKTRYECDLPDAICWSSFNVMDRANKRPSVSIITPAPMRKRWLSRLHSVESTGALQEE